MFSFIVISAFIIIWAGFVFGVCHVCHNWHDWHEARFQRSLRRA